MLGLYFLNIFLQNSDELNNSCSVNLITTQPKSSSTLLTNLPTTDNDTDPFSNEMEKVLDNPTLNPTTSLTSLTTSTNNVNNNDKNPSTTDYYTLVTINPNDITSTDSVNNINTEIINTVPIVTNNTTPVTVIEVESDENKCSTCCCRKTTTNKSSSSSNIKSNPNTNITVVDDTEEVEQKSCCCALVGCLSVVKNIFCPAASYICTCTVKDEKLENTETFEVIENGKTTRQVKNNAYSTKTRSTTANCSTCADACKALGIVSSICCGGIV